MGWVTPDEGEFSGIDSSISSLRGVIASWEGLSAGLSSASGSMPGVWSGSASQAWCGACDALRAAIEANTQMARDLQAGLLVYSNEVPGRIVPEAKAAKLAIAGEEADLARARVRLAADMALDPDSSFVQAEQKRVDGHLDEIERHTQRLERLGQERRSAAAALTRVAGSVEFTIEPVIGSLGLDLPVGQRYAGLDVMLPTGASGGFGQGVGDEIAVGVPVWWLLNDVTMVDPATIRAQWDQLNEVQKRALINANPLVLGNLDGIPVGWRANANEINVRNEIARLEAQIDEIHHPNPFILTSPTQALGDQSRIDKIQAKIDYYKLLLGTAPYRTDGNNPEETWRTAYFDPDGNRVGVGADSRKGWPKGSQLILFDPANQRIATYHGVFDKNGDIPTTYDSIATHVPGTGTTPWGFGGTDIRAAQIHHDCNKSGLGSQAMIVWSGGPQPQDIPAAMNAKYAHDLGPRLAQFTDVNIPKGPTHTVMGHSYGGTTVAQAEAAGMSADRVMYIAPAGYGEAPKDWPRDTRYYPPTIFGGGGSQVPDTRFLGLDDFPNTSDKPHYVMTARNDDVVGLIQQDPFNIHGDSPTHDPRVTRLETGFIDPEEPERGYVDDKGLFQNHSNLFDHGSTARDNMMQVIMGGTAQGWEPDALKEDEFGRLTYRDEKDWPDVKIE